MTTQTPWVKPTVSETCLYMAMELSSKKWELAFSDGSARRCRRRSVSFASLTSVISPATSRAG